jgi:hypothetical protein
MNLSIDADNFLRTLALAVARNDVGAALPIDDVLRLEGVDRSSYEAVKDNQTFRRYVGSYTKELTDSGFSFAAKCRVLAEDLLATGYKLVKDVDAPAHARVKMMENLVRWADLEPKQTAQVQAGPGFSITINVPGAAPVVAAGLYNNDAAVDVTPKQAAPTMSIPHKPRARQSRIFIDEPDSFEYAGEDIIA